MPWNQHRGKSVPGWPPYSNRAAIEQHQSGNRVDHQNTCQSSAAAREPIGHSQSSQSCPGPQSGGKLGNGSGATPSLHPLTNPSRRPSRDSAIGQIGHRARLGRLDVMPDWPDWTGQLGQSNRPIGRNREQSVNREQSSQSARLTVGRPEIAIHQKFEAFPDTL